jgi:hypothetical protein
MVVQRRRRRWEAIDYLRDYRPSFQQKRKPWQSGGAAPQVLQRDIFPDGYHEQYRT